MSIRQEPSARLVGRLTAGPIARDLSIACAGVSVKFGGSRRRVGAAVPEDEQQPTVHPAKMAGRDFARTIRTASAEDFAMAKAQVDGWTEKLVGHAGSATARFASLPYRMKDGRRRFANGEFGADLIDALYRALPPEPKRFLLGRAKCRRCGVAVETEAVTRSFALQLHLRDLDELALTLEMPAVACAACGFVHRTGDRNVESDVSDAMIAAFESGGLTY